nr:MerR family transcriptional regulator [Actinomycetospora cinnamomea]
MGPSGLTAGQAAAAAGVSRKAMRIYEDRGLVVPLCRTAAGYRLFGQDEVDTLRFIRRARVLGLKLDDIADILAEHRRGGPVCPTVKGRLVERVREIDKAIDDLAALRRCLIEAVGECAEVTSQDRAAVCPVIEGAEVP